MRSTKLIRWVLPVIFVVGVFLTVPAHSFAKPPQIAVGISVGFAPPALPYYDQPLCPGDGYIWTPGYWAWDGSDYYWVPGTWVEAPFVGGYWTPGYWGWGGSAFLWHEGYWGPEVGFYGGINYGFGYGGVGYLGGRWDGGHFSYNTYVSHVNVREIHNTYSQPVAHVHPGRVDFNGGTGGIQRQPTADERAAEGQRRAGPTGDQAQHDQAARGNSSQHFNSNHGTPTVAATGRAGDFSHGQPATTRPAYRPPTNGGNTGRAGNQPAHTNNTAPHGNTPSHTNTAPPAHTNSAPPAHTNNAPSHPNNAPSHTNNAPSHTNNAPSHSAPPPHSGGGGESHGGGGAPHGDGGNKPPHSGVSIAD